MICTISKRRREGGRFVGEYHCPVGPNQTQYFDQEAPATITVPDVPVVVVVISGPVIVVGPNTHPLPDAPIDTSVPLVPMPRDFRITIPTGWDAQRQERFLNLVPSFTRFMASNAQLDKEQLTNHLSEQGFELDNDILELAEPELRAISALNIAYDDRFKQPGPLFPKDISDDDSFEQPGKLFPG